MKLSALSKKIFSAILIGGFLMTAGQVANVEAANNSAYEINFNGAKKFTRS